MLLVKKLQVCVDDLFSCKYLNDASVWPYNFDIDVGRIILAKTRSIHELGELLCSHRNFICKQNFEIIKFNVAKIMAYIFMEFDEIVYAKFPVLVPDELVETKGSYNSIRDPTDVSVGDSKRIVLKALDDIVKDCEA
jgi:hypothetical protein